MVRCKWLAVFFVFLFLFTLSCGEDDNSLSDRSNQEENLLRFDVSAPFNSLNPGDVSISGSTYIFPFLYSYLFSKDDRGKWLPDLAVRWSYDAQHFIWEIELRSNALFHNGHRVTTKDVKYSIDYICANQRPATFALIDRIDLLSDTTMRIHTIKHVPNFIEKISRMEIIPFTDDNNIDYFNHPIGSGPFQFKKRNKEKRIELEVNDNYYLDASQIHGIVFSFEPDKEKIWSRLLSGKTDIAQEITPKNFQMIRQYEKRFYFNLYPLYYYRILLFNTTDPLFIDKKVRIALSHAIDRQYIIKNILQGYGEAATGPMAVDSPYRNPDVQPIPYDPQKALMLLEEVGWRYDRINRYLVKNGQGFEFSIYIFEGSLIDKKVAAYLKLCFNDIGIKVSIQPLPFEDLVNRYTRNTDFQAVLTEMASVENSPEELADLWVSDVSGKSIAGNFNHPALTELIRLALEEKDPSLQRTKLFEIDAMFFDLQPAAFLFHKIAIDAMSKRFKLRYPFSLSSEDLQNLRYAVLDSNRSTN